MTEKPACAEPSASEEALSGFWPEQPDEPAYSFTVSDPEEISELMPLIQYSSVRRWTGVSRTDFVTGVSILDNSAQSGAHVCAGVQCRRNIFRGFWKRRRQHMDDRMILS